MYGGKRRILRPSQAARWHRYREPRGEYLRSILCPLRLRCRPGLPRSWLPVARSIRSRSVGAYGVLDTFPTTHRSCVSRDTIRREGTQPHRLASERGRYLTSTLHVGSPDTSVPTACHLGEVTHGRASARPHRSSRVRRDEPRALSGCPPPEHADPGAGTADAGPDLIHELRHEEPGPPRILCQRAWHKIWRRRSSPKPCAPSSATIPRGRAGAGVTTDVLRSDGSPDGTGIRRPTCRGLAERMAGTNVESSGDATAMDLAADRFTGCGLVPHAPPHTRC